jgi:hypothetical protein
MWWVVMRLNLASALTDDNGLMVWKEFKMAQKTAINFGGIVVEMEEAYRIMTKMSERKNNE